MSTIKKVHKKLLLCPFFGPLPEFFGKWRESVARLEPAGYDVLVTSDLQDFNDRCERVLGFRSPIVPGTGKLWDFRCALGLLFEEEIKNYEFWGTADFDVVWGRVQEFISEETLCGVDIVSNEKNYVGGHFTLYRNTPTVNELFKRAACWQAKMKDPNPNGWVEFEYTQTVKEAGDVRYQFVPSQATRDNEGLSQLEDGALIQNGSEVMLAHFREQKRWPL